MIKIENKTKCSGCHACAQICPKQCILMKSDEEGFLYPIVDSDLCIKCGLCEKSCPILNPLINEKAGKEITVYSAMNRDDKVRSESSSGGIFSLIASCVIEQGGVVFGAAFDNNFNVEHQYAETLEGIAAFRGSKYVQSRIGDTYKRAQDFLKEGRLVLFTGTPCQISGLLAYLKKDYSNLITQDFICHGVPSPIVWKKYVEYREAKAASKTRRMFFRHKKYGWKAYSVLFEFSNNTEYLKEYRDDPYMKAFLTNLSLRPSCYNCSFKTKARPSDITLADFWGIQKIAPEMDDDGGTSLVFVNSEKGQRLLDSINGNVNIKREDVENVVQYNIAMIESVKQPQKRNAFFESIRFEGWDKTEKAFLKEDKLISTYKRIINFTKAIVKRIIQWR